MSILGGGDLDLDLDLCLWRVVDLEVFFIFWTRKFLPPFLPFESILLTSALRRLSIVVLASGALYLGKLPLTVYDLRWKGD